MHARLFALTGALILGSGATAATIHVDATAPAGGDGTSWASAFTHLQDGLAAAVAGDEIRVAAGTYRPDRDAANPTGTGLRSARFTLLDDVTVAGGYAGLAGADPDFRDTTNTPTVLSGDLAGDDGPGFANNGENSLHVVFGNGTAASAVLDGVTITAGNANTSSSDRFGGGALVQGGDATFNDVSFVANRALFGGGVFVSNGGSPTFTGCLFLANDSTQQGGGAYANTSGGVTFTSCRFFGNSTVATGGGLYARSIVNVLNSVFSGNSAGAGGGINTIAGTTTIANCSFSNNTSVGNGPAINTQSGGPTAPVFIDNSIIWNHASGIGLEGGTVTVNRSIVEGGWTGLGSGNLDLDPLYADANGADNVVGTADDDLRITVGSPAVDAGDNAKLPASITTDLAGNPRIVAALSPSPLIDMGAYELPANDPPTADIVFEQLTGIGNEATVRLDGTGSTDPNSPTPDLNFRWVIDGVEVCNGDFATCGVIEVSLGFGARDIVLEVTDPDGASDSTSTQVVLDPASLSVFSARRARVFFCGNFSWTSLTGEIALPSGLDYTEVTPFAMLELRLAGQDILPITPAPVPFTVSSNGKRWRFHDVPATGLYGFSISWSDARFRYRQAQRLVRIRSQVITSDETVLTVFFKRNAIGGPFSIDFDGQAVVNVDAAGNATGNVDVHEDRAGKVFSVTLPFAIDENSTITLSGCVSDVIDVADHFVPSVGRYRIVAKVPNGQFPDGAGTTPRTIDAFLMLGATGYPGSINLDDSEVQALGNFWRFVR